MSIYDYTNRSKKNFSKSYNDRKDTKGNVSLADEKFLSNMALLESIKKQPWFELIIDYWENELIESANFLRDVDASKSHEIAKAQARFELAQKFTNFISKED